MARTPISTNDTQDPPDLLNMTNDNPRTGPPPPMDPFDTLIGYPTSIGPSRDPRYPFTQESLSGIDPYHSTKSPPPSISSGNTLNLYSDLSTIPGESTSTTRRPRMDPPTEDPRLTDSDDNDARPATSVSMTSDAMPSLIHDPPSSAFGDHPMTFSDQLAALDLSSDAGPHPTPDPWATTTPTTPYCPQYQDSKALLELTSPMTGRRISRSSVIPLDRVAFGHQHYPTPIPIKVYYTSRSYVKRGRGPGVTHWRLTKNGAYTGAFGDWQIGLTPGDYEFEDCGSPLFIIGEQHGSYVLFVSPLLTNYAWVLQRHTHIDITTPLAPCWLHVSQSRGPRIGGYIHPHLKYHKR
jgi:hypothetical protein